MPKNKKPLPTPPNKKPFGHHQGSESSQNSEGMIADKMSVAMAQGKLDSFIEKEFDGNKNASKLANMMMGMTGMGQGFAPPTSPAPEAHQETPPSETKTEADAPTPEEALKGIAPPEEILKATMSGDVKKLTELLKKASMDNKPEGAPEEDSAQGTMPPKRSTAEAPLGEEEPTAGTPVMEKQILKDLIEMSSKNSVSVDWLIEGALKLYLQDYKNTGRM